MIQGLVQLFLFQALGELLSKFALPFIPGPVLGLVMLLAFLVLRGRVPEHIDLVGSGILQHLGLLFIPASVGVVLYLPLLQANAWALSAALVLSVLATVAVTAVLLKLLSPKPPAAVVVPTAEQAFALKSAPTSAPASRPAAATPTGGPMT